MSNQKTLVLDLDGTACNIKHREHLAIAGRWDDFNSLCGSDEPNRDVLEFVSMASEHCKILIVTGRTDDFRNVTVAWLRDHHVPFDDLLMRPEGDYTSSGELKIRLLEGYFGSSCCKCSSCLKDMVLKNVVLALDDRNKDAKALRDYGINTWQVREGAY